ncbi:unnamed protein product [Calicophoron daubneyi]|uniref:RRM domain-containing protein n=1 Tax=Calicophoron daubneyi TaxID=300641 RepID=A0AAV2TZ85_CALDB
MTSAEDVLEFEEQIRLQNETRATSSSKTRVDPDGTVMEWDERRKAWFPKIDEDFIARYQMNYGVIPAEQNAAPNSTSVGWTDFNAQLARLRQEKGEDSEEVRNLTKAAQDALASYYNSPEYREWYEAYCRSKQEDQTQQTVSSKQPAKPAKMKLNNLSLRPAERVLSAFGNTQDDAEAALARAEAEQQAGVPLPLESTAPELQAENKESIQQQEQVTEKDGAAESQASKKRKATAPKPAWYEMDDTKNTHVYVTGLPPDITEKQFAELMSKYGVIMNEPFTNKLRAKLYLDSSGKPKGDGRCCYVKVESVDLALKLLDGMIYSPGYVLHAERAKFQLRGQFDPHKRRRLTLKEKKKLKAQQESLFRWGIDVSKFVRSKKERVVVLKNAFLETDFVHLRFRFKSSGKDFVTGRPLGVICTWNSNLVRRLSLAVQRTFLLSVFCFSMTLP